MRRLAVGLALTLLCLAVLGSTACGAGLVIGDGLYQHGLEVTLLSVIVRPSGPMVYVRLQNNLDTKVCLSSSEWLPVVLGDPSSHYPRDIGLPGTSAICHFRLLPDSRTLHFLLAWIDTQGGLHEVLFGPWDLSR